MRCSRCGNELRHWTYVLSGVYLNGRDFTVNLCHVCMAHLVGHTTRQRLDDFLEERGWQHGGPVPRRDHQDVRAFLFSDTQPVTGQ